MQTHLVHSFFYILILNTHLPYPPTFPALIYFILFATEASGVVLALVSMLWQAAFVNNALKQTFAN